MAILKRFENALLNTYCACKNELDSNPVAYRRLFVVSTSIGAFVNGIATIYAADNVEGVEELAGAAEGILSSIYVKSFGVVTLFAALMASIAWVTRMSGNQQKSAQATSWLVRILIAYIGYNVIGLVISVVQSSTNKTGWFEPNLTR